MTKFWKEPLLHFLIIAAAIFAVYSWLNKGEDKNEQTSIDISQGRIDHFAATFEKKHQRKPNNDELKNLIQAYILEEAYYREAKNLNIDKNDDIIRRRLRQKMEYMLDGLAALEKPSNAQLLAFYEEEKENYRLDDILSFEQIFISFDSNDYKEKQQNLTKQLEMNGDLNKENHNNSLFLNHYENITHSDLDKKIGQGFSLQLKKLPLNEWSGPISSSFGSHFIKMTAYKKGDMPSFEQLRPRLEREWLYKKQQDIKKDYELDLLDKYIVNIETTNEISSIERKTAE